MGPRNTNFENPELFANIYPWKQILPFTTLVTSLVVLMIYYWLVCVRPLARKLNKLKGPISLPIIGGSYKLFNTRRFHDVVKETFKTSGAKTGRIWLGISPYMVTMDTKVIQKILSDPSHLDKSEAYKNAHFFMGKDGLIIEKSEKWRKDRKLLVPAFKGSMYGIFVESFNRNTVTLMDILEKKFQNNTQDMDILKYLGRCSLDITFETALDLPAINQKNPENGIYEAYTTCSILSGKKTFESWINFPPIWHLQGYAKQQKQSMKILRHYLSQEVIIQKIKEWKRKLSESGSSNYIYQKFSDILCRTRTDTDNIFFNYLVILAAGFETTSTVLNHCLYMLALNPKIQDKLFEEIFHLLGNNFDTFLTLEHISQLKYTEAVLKETMRYHPPAPIIGRSLGADLDIGDCTIVPKGTNALIHIWNVHHDPDLYKDPENFVPERFIKDNNTPSESKDPCAFIPFSYGPRGCMGAKYAMVEMKIILAKIIQKFRVTTQKRLEDVVFSYRMVTTVHGGLPINLTSRI